MHDRSTCKLTKPRGTLRCVRVLLFVLLGMTYLKHVFNMRLYGNINNSGGLSPALPYMWLTIADKNQQLVVTLIFNYFVR